MNKPNPSGKPSFKKQAKPDLGVDLPEIDSDLDPWPELEGSGPGFRDGEERVRLALADGDLSGQRVKKLILDKIKLTRVNLGASEFAALNATDILLDTCDLANAEWRGASFLRLKIANSRMVGFRCNEAELTNLLVTDTSLRLAQFRFTKFERVRFEHCDLTGADFYSADLRKAVFLDCELTEAQFCGANLAGADIRGSRIEGLQILPEDLKGLIVEPTQAMLLATVVGLVIKYD
ncbi:MAG TPA: pentapeptide repeat-containing protein [Capsulimonadaceae bacterium]|nr:pentapeptide repeat-containing protein [Capsulimonadaceae bacterium]